MLWVHRGLFLSRFGALWLEEGHGMAWGVVGGRGRGRRGVGVGVTVTRASARRHARAILGQGVTERVAASDHDVLLPVPRDWAPIPDEHHDQRGP